MANILLVDDNDMFRDTIYRLLSSKGHSVFTAKNGITADHVYRQHPETELIICDIKMPEMDGTAFTRLIRSRSKVSIVLITGFSDIAETLDAHEIGADGFLAKPFQSQELFETIDRCLSRNGGESGLEPTTYCKLGIDDFANGRQIKFNIFVRLSERKHVKIAHNGEDISPDRIRFLKQRGVHYLYLRQQDFRKYVGIAGENVAPQRMDTVTRLRKLEMLRHCGETLDRVVKVRGLEEEEYNAAKAFIEACVDAVSDDGAALDLLESLRSHTDFLFAHSLGVSLYSLMIAQKMDWNLPQNRFKVALGGLFHDIGEKEIAKDILERTRSGWTLSEVRHYESHPLRGLAILEKLEIIPQDVREIVKQHHENSLPRGCPTGVKKAALHPMSKLITVADEFCYRVLPGQGVNPMEPIEALQQMKIECGEVLDKKYMDALVHLFKEATRAFSS